MLITEMLKLRPAYEIIYECWKDNLTFGRVKLHRALDGKVSMEEIKHFLRDIKRLQAGTLCAPNNTNKSFADLRAAKEQRKLTPPSKKAQPSKVIVAAQKTNNIIERVHREKKRVLDKVMNGKSIVEKKLTKLNKKKKIAKVVAISDLHCPLTDFEWLNWVIATIEEEKPDVLVIAGDLFEAEAASRWESEADWVASDERYFVSEVLKMLADAAPNAIRVFISGNHDDNFLALGRVDKHKRDTFDWRLTVPEFAEQLWLLGGMYDFKQEETLKIGGLRFAHGFRAGGNAGEMQAIELCNPKELFIFGHTHRPYNITRAKRTATVFLPYWHCNIGCGCALDMHYMQRVKKDQWGHALGVFETYIDENDTPENELQWAGEVRILKTNEAIGGLIPKRTLS